MKNMFEHTKKPNQGEWRKGDSLNANLNRNHKEMAVSEPTPEEYIFEYVSGENDDYEKAKILLEKMVEKKQWNTILGIGRDALIQSGLLEAEDIPLHIPAGAIALAEAINLGAKAWNCRLYDLKPAMIVSAWKIGAKFGCGEDEAYYLFDPYVGTASFHGPGGEIEWYVEKLGEEMPTWEYDWSGVIRQNEAFQVVADFKSGEGVIPPLRDGTTPWNLSRPPEEIDPEKEKKDAIEKVSVLYSAHFVDNIEALKEQFPPVHANEHYDHCTFEFKPELGRTGVRVGDTTEIRIIGRVTDDKIDALLVDDPKSKKKNPHITLSVAPGVRPSQSNDSIESAMLDGKVDTSVSGSIAVTEGYHNGKRVILQKEYKDEGDEEIA